MWAVIFPEGDFKKASAALERYPNLWTFLGLPITSYNRGKKCMTLWGRYFKLIFFNLLGSVVVTPLRSYRYFEMNSHCLNNKKIRSWFSTSVFFGLITLGTPEVKLKSLGNFKCPFVFTLITNLLPQRTFAILQMFIVQLGQWTAVLSKVPCDTHCIPGWL